LRTGGALRGGACAGALIRGGGDTLDGAVRAGGGEARRESAAGREGRAGTSACGASNRPFSVPSRYLRGGGSLTRGAGRAGGGTGVAAGGTLTVADGGAGAVLPAVKPFAGRVPSGVG
jgi:hypothetical protein